jgi:cytochrome b561
MLLGIPVTSTMLVVVGMTIFALIVFQILLGKRTIKLKGKLHMQVHRAVAYAMVVLAVVHAYAALVFVGII